MPEYPELLIDLLRHGEVEGGSCFRGRTDDALTDHGWRQLSSAVEGSNAWEEIICSPAKRCAQFAEHLAGLHGIPCCQAEWLWEMDFGDWEGATAAELAAADAEQLTAFWQDPLNQAPPGGEPFQQFQQRVLDGWHEAVQQTSKRLLMITHGGPIRIILAKVLGMPLQNLMRLEVPHASLSRVRISTDSKGNIYSSLVGLNIGSDSAHD